MTKSNEQVERRSLELGKWGNLLMAIAGVVASILSHSDALMIDGLYSGVNFFSAILAARMTSAVARPVDRRYPFGYDAFEALYVTFRSLVLLGIIAFAAFGAVGKIVSYTLGGDVPELQFGPILVYSVLMVALCLALAFWHRFNWQRTGKQSEILDTESRAAVVDAVISGGVGGGFLLTMFLRGTSLDSLVPVSDSIIVLVLSVLIIRQPVSMFMVALKQVAGASAESDTVERVRARLREMLRERPFELLDVAVLKVGRSHLVVTYINPETAIEAKVADDLWLEFDVAIRDLLGSVKTEMIIAAQSPYST